MDGPARAHRPRGGGRPRRGVPRSGRVRAPEGRGTTREGGDRAGDTGLGCSIGIGPSKLVAKVASDAEKPNGFVVLSREQACERFGPSPPGLIPGIGPKTVARLAEHGIDTLAKLGRGAGGGARLSGSGRGSGVTCGRLARFEHESPRHDRPGREVGVARDHLRLRPARPRRARSRARAARRASCARRSTARSAAVRLSASRCGSTTSRRTRARAHARRAHERPQRRDRRRTRAAARVRPAAACAAAGVRVAGLDRAADAAGGPGDDQMALAV